MILHVKVKPGSKVDQLFYNAAGELNAKIKAPAQDGRANAYLVTYLAEQFGIAKSKLTIMAGFTNPHKRIEVDMPEGKLLAILSLIQTASTGSGATTSATGLRGM